MKIESLPNQISFVVSTNNGLKTYLNSLERGRPMTPRSWLYEDKSVTEVLQLWLTELSKVKKMEHGELVYQYDTSQLKKFGPQGEVKPIKELMDIVTAGFSRADSPQPALFKTQLWQKAKEMAIKHLFKDTGLYKRLRPRAYKHVVDDMRDRDTLESNSGYPDFSRRKKPDVLKRAYEQIEDGSYKEFPAIALFRNYHQKTRLVWMYPMATNIVEGSFVQPLKEALTASGLNFFNPWRGYDHVLNQQTKLYENGKFQSASDFSATDEHFLRDQMLEVYDVIKYGYQPQYWDALKESMLQVNSIPLIIGPDKWITGYHGVSSGSNWTNDVETYMDFIGEEYLTLRGLVDEPTNAIGDDIIHSMSKYNKDFADQIAEIYQQMGFDVNSEKVTNEETWVKYLQRLVIRGYYSGRSFEKDGRLYPLLRGIYSTIRALSSSLMPEKFHSPKLWSKDMNAVRQFMILENCIDHPLFAQFVKFICKGNHYFVEFAKKQNKELNDILQASRLMPGLNPTYNQEKRDKPLSTFESIRIARTL